MNVAHLCFCVGEICCWFGLRLGGFLWLDWEGIVIKDVVDNVFLLLVFFLV